MLMLFPMDIVAENFEAAPLSKVVAKETWRRLKPSPPSLSTAVPPTRDSHATLAEQTIQTTPLLPVESLPRSTPSAPKHSVLVPASSAACGHSLLHHSVLLTSSSGGTEMSVATFVEPSTASMNLFSSSSAMSSSSPSSASPNYSPELVVVLPPPSPSSVPSVSEEGTTHIASSSAPAITPSTDAVPPPFSSVHDPGSHIASTSTTAGPADMTEAAPTSDECPRPSPSSTEFAVPLYSSKTVSSADAASGLTASASLSPTLPPEEGSSPLPVEMLPSRVSAVATDATSASVIDVSNRSHASSLPSSTQTMTSEPMTTIATPTTTSPSIPSPSTPQPSFHPSRDAPASTSFSNELYQVTALSAPPESSRTETPSREGRGVPHDQSLADSIPPSVVGASTRPSSPDHAHERSSSGTSTSYALALNDSGAKRRRPADDEAEKADSGQLSKRPRVLECKAGNMKCGLETGQSVLLGENAALPCDICCTEAGFCRECKCILCCKTIEPEAAEFRVVRCLQMPSEKGICGHAAHLECALQSEMAGVVKRSGLDMEYLCRRCDNKTDLRELVTLLLEAIGNTELRAHAEKSLELTLELMRGTERGGTGARVLERLVQKALDKVRSGVDICEVFRDLKDQGAAAEEAARHQTLVRSSSLVEDVSLQPDEASASLDDWLQEQEGSPSSHPSPGTPSSFTSRLRSHPSVTNGHSNGTQFVDGSGDGGSGSGGERAARESHVDQYGEYSHSPVEVYSNSNYAREGSKPLVRNAGQQRGNSRFRAGSSNVKNVRHDGHEAVSDSYNNANARRTSGSHQAAEHPPSVDRNSSHHSPENHRSSTGRQRSREHKKSSSGTASIPHREERVVTEICSSCGTVTRHTSKAVAGSSVQSRALKTDEGTKFMVRQNSSSNGEEPGDSDYHRRMIGGFDAKGVLDQSGGSSNVLPTKATDCKPFGTSLHLLDSECERDVQDALAKLRQSQEAEFQVARERLNAQRQSILKQYELLEATRNEFSEQPFVPSVEAFDDLLWKVAKQFSKTMEERQNFKSMLKVAEGFGSISRDELSKFYRRPQPGT